MDYLPSSEVGLLPETVKCNLSVVQLSLHVLELTSKEKLLRDAYWHALLIAPPIIVIGSALELAAGKVRELRDSQLHHSQDTILPTTLHHLISDLWDRRS